MTDDNHIHVGGDAVESNWDEVLTVSFTTAEELSEEDYAGKMPKSEAVVVAVNGRGGIDLYEKKRDLRRLQKLLLEYSDQIQQFANRMI